MDGVDGVMAFLAGGACVALLFGGFWLREITVAATRAVERRDKIRHAERLADTIVQMVRSGTPTLERDRHILEHASGIRAITRRLEPRKSVMDEMPDDEERS